MGALEAFCLGAFLGPIFWGAGLLILKLLEDWSKHIARKHSMRKWDKDQKRKYKLEKELEKLNEREY